MNPFDLPGRFWKGNLHSHTTASDGWESPEEVCRRYREASYDFLCLTDHFQERYGYPVTDSRPFRQEGFTTLLGAELHAPATEQGELWHLLAVGLPSDFAPGSPDESGPLLAARALASGAYVAAAHPAWYALSEADVLSLGAINALEIFNGTASDDNDRADSWHLADVLLQRGHRYTVCATDDYHATPKRDDRFRGWVQVRSERLDPDALLRALKAGAYYASTGPEIHDLRFDGATLTVRCSPVERIFVTARGSYARTAIGSGTTGATFDLSDLPGPYLRVTMRDRHGGRAWSNPLWIA